MFKQSTAILALLVFVLAAFGASNALNFFTARQSLFEATQEDLMPLLSGAALQDVEATLINKVRSVAFMTRDRRFKAWLEQGEKDEAFITEYLSSVRQNYDFSTTFFVSEASKHYYSYGGLLRTIDSSLALDAWYFGFRASRAAYDIDVDFDEANQKKMTLFVNYRVTDDSGKFLGVVGAGFDLAELVGKLEAFQQQFGSTVYTVDSQGFIQVHPDTDRIFADEQHGMRNSLREISGLKDLSATILRDRSRYFSGEVKINGSRFVVGSRYMPDVDWFLIAQQPEPAGVARLSTLLILNSALALLTAVIIGAMLIYLRRRFREQLSFISKIDALTGVKTEQYFEHQFDEICSLTEGETLYLLLLDLDGFHAFCANNGRSRAKQVLNRTINLLQMKLPAATDIGRVGADQFVAVIAAQEPKQLSESLSALCADIATEYEPEEQFCTASIVAVPISWGLSYQEIMANADENMLKLKASQTSSYAVV